jgi:colanic acid/amylovoran biosynthesis glycosyltransferase
MAYRLARHLPLSSARLLARRIQGMSAVLLHFHYLVDARFFLSLKRLTKLPAVVSVYGYDVSSFPRLLFGYGRRYLQPAFREMDLFLAMSQDMRRDLTQIGCPEDKIVVHYYGVDTDRFAYPERAYPEKRVVNILMCGTLEPKKAQDRVLQALHLWERSGRSPYSFTVTLMGDGSLRPRLESLVRDYGWQDRVRFLGYIPYHDSRLVEEFRRADVFTLPSITIKGDKEGIPGTIVEAMAGGLPVVSTYHAGIPEIIVNEENGLLVDEWDLESLSRALGRLIEDCSLRERLGRAAAQTAASRCRLLSRTPELERIYDQLRAGEFPQRAGVHKAVPGSEHVRLGVTSATEAR